MCLYIYIYTHLYIYIVTSSSFLLTKIFKILQNKKNCPFEWRALFIHDIIAPPFGGHNWLTKGKGKLSIMEWGGPHPNSLKWRMVTSLCPFFTTHAGHGMSLNRKSEGEDDDASDSNTNIPYSMIKLPSRDGARIYQLSFQPSRAT